MEKAYFQRMADYNVWANARLYEQVATMTPTDFCADKGAYFKSVQGTLNHLLVGDWAWLLRLKGESSAHLDITKIYHADFDDLWAARQGADADMMNFMDTVDPAFLKADLTYRNIAGHQVTKPVSLILGHVFNHGTHHRGQVHTLLTQMGYKGPSMDLVYYALEKEDGIAAP